MSCSANTQFGSVVETTSDADGPSHNDSGFCSRPPAENSVAIAPADPPRAAA